MLKRIEILVGQPGMVLVMGLICGLVGSLGTVLVSPMAAIPFLGLFAILFDSFPTVVCYCVAALFAYMGIKSLLGLLPLNRSLGQWFALASAVGLVVAVAYRLPNSWNAAAGLVPPVPQARPEAVAIPEDGVIALIEYGEAEYVRCDSPCLALLSAGKLKAVEVVATLQEPAPLAKLPGKRFTLSGRTEKCLSGQRDYTFETKDEARHNEFIRLGGLPIEYDTCLNSQDVIVDPTQQATLTEWRSSDKGADSSNPGYSGGVGVIRSVLPKNGRDPVIREARYRSGYRYVSPLYLTSFDGNAGSGSYFSPRIALSFFQEPNFPDTLAPPFWSLLANGENLGRKTAMWLDGVVDRRSRLEFEANP